MWLARLGVFGGAIALTAYGAREMIRAVEPGGVTGLEVAFAILFTLAFGWIAQSACAAVGSLLYRAGPPAAHGGEGRTALVMPVYNEDASRAAASLQAMAEDLAAAGGVDGFEIFLISDSTDPDVWVEEAAAAQRLRRAVSIPVWYRRRAANTGKKAGNVKDFVTRWGGRYDFMIVLDADSLMSGATLLALRDRIAEDPDMALLQTAPVLAGRRSLFARMQQFAGRVYGPIAARGVAVWSGDDGNFWGHNAIIRVRAFAESCGLPVLPGRRPFGGPIMSHDFVEAALLRRRGWNVRMAPELGGSWEESPPSLLAAAARDRRWAQGNIQHTRVLGAQGLSIVSRIHMAIGIMSYAASPLWMTLLIVGAVLSLQARLADPVYFQEAFGLFPNWPRFDSERMLRLFGLAMLVLLTPKLVGLVRAMFVPELRRPAGAHGLVASWFVELVLSALYAPVMLVIQCRQIWEILWGADSGWDAQQRDETAPPWDWMVRRHAWHMAVGVLGGLGMLAISPYIFLWVSPTLVGLVLAAPLSRWSGSREIGIWLRRKGLLVTPEEAAVPALFERRDALAAGHERQTKDAVRALAADPALRETYLEWFTPRPRPERGQPDLDRLSAAAKIGEASSVDEAADWMSANDRRAVLGDAELIGALARLPVKQSA